MFTSPVQANAGIGLIPKPGNKPTWRGLTLLAVTVFSILAVYYLLINPTLARQEMTQAQLFDLIKQGRVSSIVNEPDPSTGIRTLTGTFTSAPNAASGTPAAVQSLPNSASGAFKVRVDLALNPYIAREIEQAGYQGTIETENNTNILWPLVINLLPVILFGGWLLFICICLTRILYKAAFCIRGT